MNKAVISLMIRACTVDSELDDIMKDKIEAMRFVDAYE